MLAFIHVFLDNARYHHAKLVQEWLALPGRRIKLHFIPTYCPLCVPKTLSALISRRNHLTSVDHVRTVLLRPGRLGLAIQVEEPT
jgi:transposase